MEAALTTEHGEEPEFLTLGGLEGKEDEDQAVQAVMDQQMAMGMAVMMATFPRHVILHVGRDVTREVTDN